MTDSPDPTSARDALCKLLRFTRNGDPGAAAATKRPDGQIDRMLSSPPAKNISLHPDGQISGITPRVSPERGADRDRHERCGGMQWTRSARETSACDADGEVVWFWR